MINKMLYRRDLANQETDGKEKKMKDTLGYGMSDLSSCWKCIHC